jgi:D-alanyl-D-alanine carboxypeptidase/D-alanyl-D-alanine-endopeptidase (penicillin-binding protein 4)
MRLLPLLLLLACVVARAQGLPPPVEAALARARLPADSVAVLVTDVDPSAAPRVAHRIQAPLNPASIAKLATTFAALELLGPAYTWTTPVYADGPLEAGTLRGNLYIRGTGDPKLVFERMWLLLRRLRGLGIERIAGDIVLDRGAFQLPASDPAAFDGEPLRPYNAAPDALLVNFKSVVLTFVPRGDGTARVVAEPPLAGVQWPSTVPLAGGPCGDWRAALQLDLRDPLQPRLAGAYPQACGERLWPLAFPDPAGFAARAIGALWTELGGSIAGTVRDGQVPAHASPLASITSPTLAEVVRDINKFSNNVMARQVFLTLALQPDGSATPERAREVLRGWWRQRIGEEPPTFDNGSGLSRDERATARQLGRLLQVAWASPLMPEFVASLPAAGIDGTMRRSTAPVAAHLKTGSLRDVQGVAGYVHAASGKRYVVVAIANHPNAGAVRPALEALLTWVAQDR